MFGALSGASTRYVRIDYVESADWEEEGVAREFVGVGRYEQPSTFADEIQASFDLSPEFAFPLVLVEGKPLVFEGISSEEYDSLMEEGFAHHEVTQKLEAWNPCAEDVQEVDGSPVIILEISVGPFEIRDRVVGEALGLGAVTEGKKSGSLETRYSMRTNVWPLSLPEGQRLAFLKNVEAGFTSFDQDRAYHKLIEYYES